MPPEEKTPLWKLILAQFEDQMVQVLLVAALISLVSLQSPFLIIRFLPSLKNLRTNSQPSLSLLLLAWSLLPMPLLEFFKKPMPRRLLRYELIGLGWESGRNCFQNQYHGLVIISFWILTLPLRFFGDWHSRPSSPTSPRLPTSSAPAVISAFTPRMLSVVTSSKLPSVCGGWACCPWGSPSITFFFVKINAEFSTNLTALLRTLVWSSLTTRWSHSRRCPRC